MSLWFGGSYEGGGQGRLSPITPQLVGYQYSATGSLPTNTRTLPVYQDTEVGDLVIAQIGCDDDDNLSAPDGWTDLGQQSGFNLYRMRLWMKYADAEDVGSPSGTHTFSVDAQEQMAAVLMTFRNPIAEGSPTIEAINAITGDGSWATGASGPAVASGITTTLPSTLLLCAIHSGSGLFENPSDGMDLIHTVTNNTSIGITMGAAWKRQKEIGATGTRQLEIAAGADDEDWAAVLIALSGTLV